MLRDAPLYAPTAEEFQDFARFIANIEEQCREYGCCRIVPPEGWAPRDDSYVAAEVDKFQIQKPIKQFVVAAGRSSGVYHQYNVESKSMLVGDLKASEEEWQRKLLEPTPETNEPNFAEIERRFWKTISMTPPIYGADVKATLFTEPPPEPPKKGRKKKNPPAGGERRRPWDLGNLESILRLIDVPIPGVNIPYLYFGTWKSVFACHTEDMDLYSINYLHYGAPKIWYVIPPDQASQFEAVAQEHFGDLYKECSQFLRHKMVLMEPSVLLKRGINVMRAIQRERQFVITFPRAYHWGFNSGINCAEAINFATERWIPYGVNAKPCQCVPDSVRINMDRFIELYRAWQQNGRPPLAAAAVPVAALAAPPGTPSKNSEKPSKSDASGANGAAAPSPKKRGRKPKVRDEPATKKAKKGSDVGSNHMYNSLQQDFEDDEVLVEGHSNALLHLQHAYPPSGHYSQQSQLPQQTHAPTSAPPAAKPKQTRKRATKKSPKKRKWRKVPPFGTEEWQEWLADQKEKWREQRIARRQKKGLPDNLGLSKKKVKLLKDQQQQEEENRRLKEKKLKKQAKKEKAPPPSKSAAKKGKEKKEKEVKQKKQKKEPKSKQASASKEQKTTRVSPPSAPRNLPATAAPTLPSLNDQFAYQQHFRLPAQQAQQHLTSSSYYSTTPQQGAHPQSLSSQHPTQLSQIQKPSPSDVKQLQHISPQQQYQQQQQQSHQQQLEQVQRQQHQHQQQQQHQSEMSKGISIPSLTANSSLYGFNHDHQRDNSISSLPALPYGLNSPSQQYFSSPSQQFPPFYNNLYNSSPYSSFSSSPASMLPSLPAGPTGLYPFSSPQGLSNPSPSPSAASSPSTTSLRQVSNSVPPSSQSPGSLGSWGFHKPTPTSLQQYSHSSSASDSQSAEFNYGYGHTHSNHSNSSSASAHQGAGAGGGGGGGGSLNLPSIYEFHPSITNSHSDPFFYPSSAPHGSAGGAPHHQLQFHHLQQQQQKQ